MPQTGFFATGAILLMTAAAEVSPPAANRAEFYAVIGAMSTVIAVLWKMDRSDRMRREDREQARADKIAEAEQRRADKVADAIGVIARQLEMRPCIINAEDDNDDHSSHKPPRRR